MTLLVIAGLVGFYTHRLALERDRAQREEQEARQVATLLTSLFDGADPDQARGAAVTARELLDVGAVKIRAELAEQPELKARLLDRIAAIYLRLGLFDESAALLDESEVLRGRLFVGDHLAVAAGLRLCGLWHQDVGEYADAETLLRRSLEMRRRLLGPEHPEVAASLTDLGELFFARVDYEVARELYSEALAMRRRLGSPDPVVASSLHNVAAVLYTTGKARTALPLLEETLEIQLRSFDEVHPEVATTFSTLGSVYSRSGDVDRAREHFRRALEIRRRIYGDDHPIVARSLTNLGYFLDALGEHENAEPLLHAAVGVFRRLPDPRQLDFARSLVNLSRNLGRQGHHQDAEKLIREALAMARRALDPGHPIVPRLWMALGDALAPQDRLADAASAYRDALEHRRANLPEGHGLIADPLVFLARTELEREDVRQAELLLEEALAILRGRRPDDWLTAEASILLGSCRMQQLRVPEARELLREGLRILETGTGAATAVRNRLTEQARARLDEIDRASETQI